ncbi:hypothetical protein POSPLADRAFT_1150265 [Postia placenta MAD-698-R-SB12]|uniref:Aminotransferase class I/classII large domain-containing protein n=1 Tax=Postia placenta MAD-698-R-SB12 TaxID=670580 RepID=A0A1X6MT91_9APHY|nr:hypothetical protein POSPLADRAFT_1150265 [Postia placenta MAD-698-R-SB12]OSX59587.1 hypothetical protein POSPLADRAFT_1150265 [Postia placenta MAD-698-R-SB12]
MSNPLASTLENALHRRQERLIPPVDLLHEIPFSAPDLFSNDYLSLTTEPQLRQSFLDELSRSPLVFGTGGSRLMSGNLSAHTEFEARMKAFFGAPAALLFNSGYDANVAFWHSVPQAGDAVILDEYVHASTRDGVATSRIKGSLYTFVHNSVSSLRDCIPRVLEKHPDIAAGKGTVFIAVESLYSMDGDFAPLPEIVRLTKELVPPGCAHIVVDEAHSTGICGPQGRGLVAALNLDSHIDTVLHTFGKARAFVGAVILTSPVIRKYMINYGRPFIYSTSLPRSSICALNASFDYIESPIGTELMDRLRRLSVYFEQRLVSTLQDIPSSLLTLRARNNPPEFPVEIVSPIFPIITSAPISLASFLQRLGYAALPIPYPVVPRGQERIRIVVHARNTEEEVDGLLGHMVEWATTMQTQEMQLGQVMVGMVQAMTRPEVNYYKL